MGCNCGKPKCKGQCGCKSPAVLQINNPAEYITFHKVVIPASLGDSTTNPPRNGAYRNVLVFYEADQTSWLYSTDGIPTKLTNGITNYEDATNLPQINGVTLIGNKTGHELGLQDQIIAGDNIQISDDGRTISATDTTYTAGEGLILDGTEFSADTDILATKSELSDFYTKAEVDAGTDSLGVPDGFFSGGAKEESCDDTIELTDMIGGAPSELKISGKTTQQTYAGKNLFDRYHFSVDNKYIASDGTETSGTSFAISNYIPVTAGNEYTYSGTTNRDNYGAKAAWYDSSKQWLSSFGFNQTGTVTAPSDARYVRFSIRNAYTETGDASTMQVEAGSTATSYEKFVGGRPSPSPEYPQAVESVTGEQTITVNGNAYKINLGKNLFDKNNPSNTTLYVNGSGVLVSGTGVKAIYIPCSPNTTYTVSKTNAGSQNRFSVYTTAAVPTAGVAVLEDVGTRSGEDAATSYSITTGPTASYLSVYYKNNYTTLSVEEILSTIQIEENNTATPYANYIEPVRLNSLDFDGLYSDYIFKDGDDWKVHRATSMTTIKSLYDGASFSIDTSSTNTTRVLITSCLGGQAIYSPTAARSSSKTQYFSYVTNWSSDTVGFFTDTNSTLTKNGLCFRGLKTTIGTTQADVETWINNHPIDVYYVLATPVDEVIESPQIRAQLDEVRLATGANTITISSVGLTGGLCVSGYKDNWAGTIAEIKDEIETNRKVFRFKTAQDLQASADLKNGDIAMTAGYYTPQDGGAGKYYIKAASTTADGGSVLNIGGGLQAFLIAENDIINIKQFGAKGDGTSDDSEALRNALAFNGNANMTIEFVKSETYVIDGNFYIYSNTTLELNESTIKTADGAPSTTSYNKVQFMNNLASMTIPGYGALKNFVVKNGTFDGNAGGVAFPLFHAQDCRFENIDFLNGFVSTHIFDLAGCKNITVKNCNFIGNLLTTAANNFREVIQPDYATYSAAPYWGNDGSFAFDAIPTDGLTVDGCVFKKNDSDTYYLNGVGTHAANEAPHNNIVVKNCEFYDCQYSCIRLMKANNILIENNTFYNIRTDRTTDNFAINISNEGSSGIMSLHGVAIRGNKYISTQPTTDQVFIKVFGRDSYLTTDVVIENNIYNGTSVSEADYVGNDCAQSQNTDGMVFRNNIVNRAKAVLFVGGKPATNLKFVNNTLNGCLRGVRANSDTYIDPGNFIYANNYWTNPIAAIDTSGTRIELGLEEDLAISTVDPTNTNLPLAVTKGIDLYIGTNQDACIPDYIRRVRISGTIAVQTTSGGTLNTTRSFIWDRKASAVSEEEYCYYNADTNGETISFSIGDTISDNTNLSWTYFGSNLDKLWRDGRKVFTLRVNTTGDVTVLKDGTKIIIEAF